MKAILFALALHSASAAMYLGTKPCTGTSAYRDANRKAISFQDFTGDCAITTTSWVIETATYYGTSCSPSIGTFTGSAVGFMLVASDTSTGDGFTSYGFTSQSDCETAMSTVQDAIGGFSTQADLTGYFSTGANDPSITQFSSAFNRCFTAPLCPLADKVQIEGVVSSKAEVPSTHPLNNFCRDTDCAIEDIEGDGKNPCFPAAATVRLANNTRVRIDSLREGDQIYAADADGTVTTDAVSLLSIANPNGVGSFITLSTNLHHNLTLTPEHHVPVGATCCTTLKKAKDVAINETMWGIGFNRKVVKHRVVKKMTTTGPQTKGLFSPVMRGGRFPIVDDIATAFDEMDKVKLASYTLPIIEPACKATGMCSSLKRLVALATGRKDKAKYIA